MRPSSFRYLLKFSAATLLLAAFLIFPDFVKGSAMAFGAPGPGDLAPELISPADGSEGLSLTPELKVEFSSFAGTPEKSKWEVCTDNTFTSPLSAEVELTGGAATWTVPAGKLKKDTTYYWKVRALYGNSPEWSDWSETWSFTTGKDPTPPVSGGGGCQSTSVVGTLWLLLPLGLVLLRRRN